MRVEAVLVEEERSGPRRDRTPLAINGNRVKLIEAAVASESGSEWATIGVWDDLAHTRGDDQARWQASRCRREVEDRPDRPCPSVRKREAAGEREEVGPGTGW